MRTTFGFIMLATVLFIFQPLARASEVSLNNVPFKSQVPPGEWSHTMNCGPTSVLMVASYYRGKTPTTDEIIQLDDWLYEKEYIKPQADVDKYNGNGMSTAVLIKLLRDYYGFSNAVKRNMPELEYLRTELQKGNPLIVAVNIRMKTYKPTHYMVLIGLTDTEVIVHDPGLTYGAFNRYPISEFQASWASSNFASIVVNHSAATWHPDGTLLKGASSDVYVLIEGRKHWIIDETVFNAHGFQMSRVIQTSQEELNCYDDGAPIDWAPYREQFSVNGKNYLMEKNSASASNCAVYEFMSETARQSWGVSAPVQSINESEANTRYFSQCADGGQLPIREGMLLKPSFSLYGFGSGVVLVTLPHGVLRAFADFATFTKMGYESLPIMLISDADEFYASIQELSPELIDSAAEQTCANGSYIDDSGGAGDDSEADLDNDGYSVNNGDCDDLNPNINPVELELCDEIDNDCDGLTDEGKDICGGGLVCRAGQCELMPVDGDLDPENEEPTLPDEDPDWPAEQPLPADEDPDPEQPLPGGDREADEETSVSTSEAVNCTISCPANMRAYAWYGSFGEARGMPAVITTTTNEVCLRGAAWLDYNCACTLPNEWACYDYSVATISCNHSFRSGRGTVDPRGEGEVWFTDFACQ